MSRILTCNGCGDPVDVYEEPREFVDPALYRCGECVRTVPEPVQLAIVEDERPARSETRSYDPAIAAIPF